MYSGYGVDIPSLASGLPFDGRTIWYNPDTQQIEVIGGTGGGSGEGVSNFWDLSGIPSWITNSKPKYTYSEIEGTPDLTKYALVSQIPSLSGYATESWVLQKNYATKATTLSGYGITDAYTKTNVDDLLLAYVTLSGSQTITGEKNFTGGLKVDGSPIYYDTEKKYWKLEGDLLVTGGVTMYGSDSSFTPSTIMDAIAVDGTTISKSGGVLKVIGGTGGGVADSVAWANITGKPTFATVATSGKYSDLSGTPSSLPASDVYSWAKASTKPSYSWSEITSKPTWIGSSKPTYSYSEITGAISTTELQNYLTQNSYLNVTSGDNRYLKLSGGTISGTYGALTIHRANENASLIKYSNTSGVLGYLGFYSSKEPFVFKGTDITTPYKIWHEGNDGSGSGLDADMLDGYHVTHFMSYIKGSGYVQANLLNSELWNVAGGDGYIEYYDNSTWFNSRWGKVLAHYGFDGDLRGNASSATKLQTARSIWGRSFDGTSDISGSLYITNNNAIYIKDTSDNWLNQIEVSSGNAFNIGYSSGGRGYSTLLYGGDITLKVGISRVTSLYIDSNRNGEYNGKFTFKRASQVPLYISNTDSSITDVCARFVVNNAYKASIGTNSGDYLLRYNADLSKSYVIWDSGNDGHNSGLDADTLDGYHSSAFMNFTATGGYVGASMGNETLSKQASGNGYIEFYDSAGGWFNFRLGNILTAGGITMYSMRALKNVVDERGLSLSELSTIKPTRYTWKDGRDNRLHFGGIADDIQQVLPEVVYSTSDGILTMDYGNAAFAVASSLIQPVVDHEKRIAMLEAENKKLIQEIERLKSA